MLIAPVCSESLGISGSIPRAVLGPKELQDLLENFCLICFVLLQRYLNNKRPELLARPQARLRPTTKEEDICVCKTSCATVGHDILNNLTKVWEGGGELLYI